MFWGDKTSSNAIRSGVVQSGAVLTWTDEQYTSMPAVKDVGVTEMGAEIQFVDVGR